MYAVSKCSARVVTVISSLAESIIETSVCFGPLISLPYGCRGRDSRERLYLLLRSHVVAIERKHLVQKFHSAFVISQAEFVQRKQEKAVHLVPLLKVILEQKQIRKRGREIIDLHFRFHAFLSKIAHMIQKACRFLFPAKGIKTDRAVIAEPSNRAIISRSCPAAARLVLTSHLVEGQSGEVIQMGLASQQMFPLPQVPRVLSGCRKMR